MSLGNDLATIRKEKNLTLEDIFNSTKIPVHTLQSIENDTLLSSSSESITYLRSFIRSYAKALKIPTDHIRVALEKTEAGTYSNDLLILRDPNTSVESYSVNKDTVEVDSTNVASTESSTASTYEEEIEESPEFLQEEPVAATQDKPTVATVNWADMSKKVYAAPTNSKLGILLGIFFTIIVLGAVGYYFGQDLFTKEEGGILSNEVTQSEPSSNNDLNTSVIDTTSTTSVPLSSPTNSSAGQNSNSAITLDDTITVAVYAAYDVLDPVRVTSDFNGKTNPFWMNQGEAYNFDFSDSLLVRGQYSRMLLLFNGHVIDNPRQNHFDPELNSVVITREILNQPRYLQAAPFTFPENLGVAAPDSIIYPIRF
ncbi:helix-turn-helix domain-containing protein [Balneola vulgaris]|uniref:helix-turn-helix domain-containing protein n=1 Tax=Balneola vulgaris TaxID=287535 RepID=UPI000360219A|nr:helix-turn-helix transcriptional regulator [Balneola vulgaris]